MPWQSLADCAVAAKLTDNLNVSASTDDMLEEKALGTAMFGIMYTVCKEKSHYSWVFIILRLLADWLQL
jgi:hypothetical protein